MRSLDQSQPQHLTREGVSITQLPPMEDQAPPKTPNHDPADVLPSILSLAALFKTCVEALSLIHAPAKSVPSPKQYESLLTKLGIQQARLLIWGDALGLSSPPAWIADHFVPTHPSPTYPDVTEPMYFPRRSARLDEPEIRKQVEALLQGILDREMNKSREEAMEEFGLRPPKKGILGNTNESKEAEELIVLDAFRLEAFREKYDLLLDVAEDKGVGGARRQSSIVATPWVIGDVDRFERFITTIRQTIDELIILTDVRKAVNLALKMDVRALGWHINTQPGSAARARQKLRAIMDACKGQYQYQELFWAAEEAMDNIAERWRGPQAYVHAIEEALQPSQNNKAPALTTTIKTTVPTLTKTAVTAATTQVTPNGQDSPRQPALAFNAPSKPHAQPQSHELPKSKAQKEKNRPAFLKVFKPKSWRNSRTSTGSGEDLDPPRAHSEWAPVVPQSNEDSDGGTLSRSRSESVPEYTKKQQDNTYTTMVPERSKSISTAVADELEVQGDDEKTHEDGVDSKLSSPVDWSNGYAGGDDMGMGGDEHTESRTRQMSIAGT